MTDKIPTGAAPIVPDQADYLIATAARAPSVHNTQPWRFRVEQSAIELYSDPRRRLRLDPKSREKLISCGAALFGLRLAVRSLGYQPVVELLPDQARPRLLARVTVGAAEPMTAREHEMLKALPHRHTHRGGFAPDPLPAGLLAGLQHDVLAERARLDIVDPGLAYQRLAEIVGMAGSRLDRDPRVRGELLHWTRHAGSSARDGVPPHAFAAHQPAGRPGGYANGTSTWAAAWGGWPTTGQPPLLQRSLSPAVIAGPTGFMLGRRCTGFCCTRRAGGCSRACTPCRSRTPRSGRSSRTGWRCRGSRRCCCSWAWPTPVMPPPAGRPTT